MSIELKINNIKTIDTQTLRTELSKSLTITAKQLQYLAVIWRELESRGEDLSALKTGLAIYLPAIANNQLDADLVVKYAGQKMLLHAISKLPLEEQRKLAEHGEVDIVRLEEDGNKQVQKITLHSLPATEINLVFAESRLRTPDEQFLILSKTKRSVKKIRKARRLAIKDNLIIVGNSSVEIERLLELLSKHYNADFKKIIQPGA
jgi:hypothetical protein